MGYVRFMGLISGSSSDLQNVDGRFFSSLPPEKLCFDIWCIVAQYLPPRDLQSLAMVSKTMRDYVVTSVKNRYCNDIRTLIEQVICRLNQETQAPLIEKLKKELEIPYPTVSHLVAAKNMLGERTDRVIAKLGFIRSPQDIEALKSVQSSLFSQLLDAFGALKNNAASNSDVNKYQEDLCKKFIAAQAFELTAVIIHKVADVSLKANLSLSLFNALAATKWHFIRSGVYIDKIVDEKTRYIALATVAEVSRELRDFDLEKRAIFLMASTSESQFKFIAYKKGEHVQEHFQSLLARKALVEVQELIDRLPERGSEESFEKMDAIAMYAEYLRIQGKADAALQMLLCTKPEGVKRDLLIHQAARNFSISGDHERSLRCFQEVRDSRTKTVPSFMRQLRERRDLIDDLILADTARNALFSGRMKEFFYSVSEMADSSSIDEILLEACQFFLARQDWENVSEIANVMADSLERDEIFRLISEHFSRNGEPLLAIQKAGRIRAIWIRDTVLKDIFQDPLQWEPSKLIEALSQISNPVSKGNMAQVVIQAFIGIEDWNRASLFIRKFFELSTQISGYLDLIQALFKQQQFSQALELIETLLENETKGSWATMRLGQEQVRIYLALGKLSEALPRIAVWPCSSLFMEQLMDFANILIRIDQKAEARKILERVTIFLKEHSHTKGYGSDKDWRAIAEAWLALGDAAPAQKAIFDIISDSERDLVRKSLFQFFLAEKNFYEMLLQARSIQDPSMRYEALKEGFQTLVNVGQLDELTQIASELSRTADRNKLLGDSSIALAQDGRGERALAVAETISERRKKQSTFRQLAEVFRSKGQLEWENRAESSLSEEVQETRSLKRKRPNES